MRLRWLRLVAAVVAAAWVALMGSALTDRGALAQVDPIPSTTEPETTTTEAPTTTETTEPPTTAAPTTTTTARPTTTTAPPPPPPPEDRTPPRQPGQAPAPLDESETQTVGPVQADMPAIFPLLSIAGFAVLGGLLGAQWFFTRPGRRGRTL